MNFRYLRILVLLCILSDPSPLFALDSPGLLPYQPNGIFSAFSPGTLQAGETGITFGLEKTVDPSFFRLTLRGEHGLMEKFDLLFTVPFVLGLDDSDGFQDMSIGLKHNVLEEGKNMPAVSYLLDASFPGKDSVSTDGRVGGGILIGKRLGPFSGNMNIFYHIPLKSSDEDELDIRAGLDLAAAHAIHILTELIVRKSHLSTRIDVVEGRLGYRVKLSRSTNVTLGVGYDFKNRTPELRLFFTVSHLFGKRKG